MLQERTQTGSLCYKKEHKLEVLCYKKEHKTGSLCYKKEHKLEVYATRKNTNWKFMLQERRHFQLEMVLDEITNHL